LGLADAKHRRYRGVFWELSKSRGFSATPANIIFNLSIKNL
jgi:hypothetical protein